MANPILKRLLNAGYPESTAKKIASGELPMDETSRMARAREQGFDVDKIVYHGTDTDFPQFDPTMTQDGLFWSTTNKAAIESGDVGAAGSGVIKELYHRIQNPAGWNEYDQLFTDQMIGKGYDGLALREGDRTTFVAFEPEQYRSVNAAFDPDQAGNPNLLASAAPVAAGGILGALGLPEDATAADIAFADTPELSEQGQQDVKQLILDSLMGFMAPTQLGDATMDAYNRSRIR